MLVFVDELDSLTRRYPESPLPLSHAVYASVKLGLLGRAMELAEGCRAQGTWWCELAMGHALHRSARTADAEAHYRNALDAMPAAMRCGFEDIEDLLPEEVRGPYADLECDARDEVHERFWWLSDPFLLDGAYDRWTEHVSRAFEYMMRMDIKEKLWHRTVRFRSRAHHMRRGFVNSYDPSPSPGRHLHRIVTGRGWWRRDAAFNHFVPDVLSLEGVPGDVRFSVVAEIDPAAASAFASDEGYTRPDGFVLPVPVQIARFREGDSLLVALASNLHSVPIGLSGQAFFVASERPDHVVTLEPAPLRERVVFAGTVADRKQLVGIEVFTPGDDGRHRTVLQPFGSATRALSDLLLLRPVGPELPQHRMGAVGLMYGTTRLHLAEPMAVYWEAYGLVSGESVRISIRLEKEEGGWLAGLTRAIGLGGSDERGTVSWTETVEGEGPFRRAVTLEVADLEPGEYELIVELEGQEGARLTRSRSLEVMEGAGG